MAYPAGGLVLMDHALRLLAGDPAVIAKFRDLARAEGGMHRCLGLILLLGFLSHPICARHKPDRPPPSHVISKDCQGIDAALAPIPVSKTRVAQN